MRMNHVCKLIFVTLSSKQILKST